MVDFGPGPPANTPAQHPGDWLAYLNYLPPNQSCDVIWRRSCPGAKAAKEGGMDLSSPAGTPVYALGAGQVIGAGYFWFTDGSPAGGVVTVRTAMPDGTFNDIYYQHIKISGNVQLCNQQGGQLYNGVVGPSPTYQNMNVNQLVGWTYPLDGAHGNPHVEVGANATGWLGIWGDDPHPGPWYDDPEPMTRELMANGGGKGSNLDTGNVTVNNAVNNAQSAVQTLSQVKGVEGPIAVFHNAQQFKGFSVPPDSASSANWPIIGGIEQGASYPIRVVLGVINFIGGNFMAFFIRAVLVTIAMVVILALIINLTSKTIEEETGASPMQLASLAAL
jgi:hypothetical protein